MLYPTELQARAFILPSYAAGFPGNLPRRARKRRLAAARPLGMERAWGARSVAMKPKGHKTENVYRRYAIVSPADHVAHRGSPEVVHGAAWHASRAARGGPHLAEPLGAACRATVRRGAGTRGDDALPRGDDALRGLLERVHASQLLGEQPANSGVRYTSRPLSFFRAAGVQAHRAGLDVHLAPLQPGELLILLTPAVGVRARVTSIGRSGGSGAAPP